MTHLEHDRWGQCRRNCRTVEAFRDTSDRKGWESQMYGNRLEHSLKCVLLKLPVSMNMLGPVLKTNSLISLCLSVWMCLFFIRLTSSPSEPCYHLGLVFFSSLFPLFSPFCFILALLSSFFLLQLFPPFTVSFSLFIIPSCFSPHCRFHLLPPPSLSLSRCCSKIRQTLFCVMGAAQNWNIIIQLILIWMF